MSKFLCLLLSAAHCFSENSVPHYFLVNSVLHFLAHCFLRNSVLHFPAHCFPEHSAPESKGEGRARRRPCSFYPSNYLKNSLSPYNGISWTSLKLVFYCVHNITTLLHQSTQYSSGVNTDTSVRQD